MFIFLTTLMAAVAITMTTPTPTPSFGQLETRVAELEEQVDQAQATIMALVPTPTATPTVTPTSILPRIVISDQETTGYFVTVAEVVSAQDGVLAIYTYDKYETPVLVGQVFVLKGLSQSIPMYFHNEYGAHNGSRLLLRLFVGKGNPKKENLVIVNGKPLEAEFILYSDIGTETLTPTPVSEITPCYVE